MCVCVCVCVCVCDVPQVYIDETDNRYDYTGLGVVTANPDTFTLPRRTLFPNPAFVSVWADGVCRFGQMVRF